MQLTSDVSEKVVSRGVGKVHEFVIKANAKAFDTLIAGLYSNKIKAVIRELSTNAYEAHQMLKIEHKPFNVKLPSDSDKTFKIRDFGPGISPDNIANIYTVLYESTKDTSNEFGGAFGLGSKSPFAYSSNFSVTSYHAGMKTVYAVNKSANGIPQMSELFSAPTTEPSGMEIEIPISKWDISTFVAEAQNVYQWFITKPNVTGNAAYKLTDPFKDVVTSGTNWWVTGNGMPSVALMGNIAYPLTSANKIRNASIFKNGVVIRFDIGEIDPTPSREQISLTQETIDAINAKTDLVIDEYSKTVSKKLDGIKNKWDAYVEARKIYATSIIDNIKLVWNGNKILSNPSITIPSHVDPVNKYNHIFDVDVHSFSYRGAINMGSESHIYPEDDVRILVDDNGKTSYKMLRIKEYLSNQPRHKTFVVNESQKADLKKILECDDSIFVDISSLPKPTINRTARKKTSKVLEVTYSGYSCYLNDAVIDDTTQGYYVDIKHQKIYFGTNSVALAGLGKILNGIKDVNGKILKVYAIRKGASSAKLKPLSGILQTECDLITKENDKNDLDNQLASTIRQSISSNTYGFLMSKYALKSSHKATSDLATEIQTAMAVKSKATYHDVIRALKDAGFTSAASTVAVKASALPIIKQAKDWEKRYPLISYISYYQIDQQTIKEIDVYLNNK